MEDQTLIIFNAISKFIKELNTHFGNKQKSLQLYSRLIEKTTIIHDEPIKKHIKAFKTFCIDNRDAITNTDYKLIVSDKISYSERVYLNIKQIFNIADTDERKVIWTHILHLSALLDPSNKAKEILKKSMNSGNIQDGKGGNEENFLNNIIDEVEEHVDPNANPMQAVSNIMQSGLFNNLVGNMNDGLQNGDLDLNKLMGTVQSMVTNLTGITKDMNMDNNNLSEDDNQNISKMMGQMSQMMGQLNTQMGNMNQEISKNDINNDSKLSVVDEVNEK